MMVDRPRHGKGHGWGRWAGAVATVATAAGAATVATVGYPSSASASPSGAPSTPPMPPWTASDDLPLPGWARSLSAKKAEVGIGQSPSAGGLRRGTFPAGVLLPLFGALRGPGCAGRFLLVGPAAWVCSDAVDLKADEVPPVAANPSESLPHDGLPYRYYFVGRGGASAYLNLEHGEEAVPDRELDPGFAVAMVEERTFNGARWGHTRHGEWLAMRELTPARPSVFHGERVEGALDFAWVTAERADVYAEPAPNRKKADARGRFQRVAWREEKTLARGAIMVRISDDGAEPLWMSARDLTRPQASAPPDEVTGASHGERWVDVDTATQTLVAYEGSRPVYATLVSSGKGAPGTDTATPKGVRRIWVKLMASTMDNLEKEDSERHYSMEDVPYVQFFDRGIALHGAFWHRDFGRPRSHGCVNLSPLDAEWLFAFTSPHLPAGWTAALPTSFDEGTVIRIR